MCLFYAKLIVVLHVGTKWFVRAKPKFNDLLMPLQKRNTLWRQLEKKKKYLSSLIVSLSRILAHVEGAVFPYVNLMSPAVLFSSEDVYVLPTWFVTLEISSDERRKKADGFEIDPNSYSLLRKSQV